jgi:hypothetical protein
MEWNLILTPSCPVGVCFLDSDFSFLDKPVENLIDIELLNICFFNTDGDIVEIDENGDLMFLIDLGLHVITFRVGLSPDDKMARLLGDMNPPRANWGLESYTIPLKTLGKQPLSWQEPGIIRTGANVTSPRTELV